MNRYAVDTDVLANIQRVGHTRTLTRLGPLPVIITDTVWEELTTGAERTGKVPRATLDEMQQMLEAIAGAPTTLEPATSEAAAFARLHSGPGTEDAGEHSLIAYASQHQDVIAVLFDRRALFRAVEELRGRVLSIHGFLDVLRTMGKLAATDAGDISSKLCRARSLVQPLWW
ncbi:MAG: hypothetical protein ACXU86_03650 [Archangium sp.]